MPDDNMLSSLSVASLEPGATPQSPGPTQQHSPNLPTEGAPSPSGRPPLSSGRQLLLDGYLEQHAPPAWVREPVGNRSHACENLDQLLTTPATIPVLVLCADIRKSTIVMRESIDLLAYGDTLGAFIEAARDAVKRSGGWFDKFTGDGFLAYWIPANAGRNAQSGVPGERPARSEGFDSFEEWMLTTVASAADVAADLLNMFERVSLPAFRTNMQNLPDGIGLSIGIDGGAASLVEIAGDLTLVGQPVVGSVRMVSLAEPWETIANVFVGELLMRAEASQASLPPGIRSVGPRTAATKEYRAQWVYSLIFDGFADRTITIGG